MMTARASNLLTGAVLLVVSLLWCWGVVETIPGADDGSRLGARGFPLGLGILLGVLSLVLLVQGLLTQIDGESAEGEADLTGTRTELWAVLSTVALLCGYALLLEYVGFIIATVLIVVIAIGPVLQVWRAKLILFTSLGLSLGVYVIFGKLLGVYLPYGKLINLAF
jgi:putative tricarboxylic transport membrane protein